MKFTVYRDSWARGDKAGPLYSSVTKRMCCLGFLGKECGYYTNDMDCFSYPKSLVNIGNIVYKWPSGIVSDKSNIEKKLVIDIIIDNDNPNLLDHEREYSLSKLFSEAGIDVEFKDRKAPFLEEI